MPKVSPEQAAGMGHPPQDDEAGARLQPPSKEEALQHRRQHMPHATEDRLWSWREMTVEKLGLEFGPGVGLYFATLKWLIVLTLALFLLYVPMLVVANASANYIEVYKPAAEKGGASQLVQSIFTETQVPGLTLGGLAAGDEAGVLVHNADRVNVYGSQASRASLLIMISVLDLVAVLAVLAWTAAMYVYMVRAVRQIDHGILDCSDYTLLLRGLPQDASEAEVYAYFTDMGLQVREVVVIPSIMEVLDSLLLRARMLRQVAEMEAKLQLDTGMSDEQQAAGRGKLTKLRLEVDKIELKITEGKQRGLDAAETMAAMVTFETEQAITVALSLLPKHGATWLLQKLLGSRQHRFRGTHVLFAAPARPPSDYVYENLSYRVWTRYWRKVMGFFVVCALLIGSLCIGVALSVARREASGTVKFSSSRLEAHMQGVRSAAATLAADLGLDPAELSTGDAPLCGAMLDMCSASLSGGILDVSLPYQQLMEVVDRRTGRPAAANFQSQVLRLVKSCSRLGSIYSSAVPQVCQAVGANPCHTCYCQGLATSKLDPDEAEVAAGQCSSYVQTSASTQALHAGVSATTVIINVLLGLVIFYLVKWEKYLSRTAEEVALTYKTVAAQLLNTAALPLVANARVPSIAHVFSGKLFAKGSPDFDYAWYSTVGVTMLLTILLNVVTTRVLAAQDYVLPALWRWWRLKVRRNVYTQEAMNALFLGNPFTLADKYIIIVFYMGVALFYAEALPVLLLFASLAFMLQYVMDKHKLLRCCQTPVHYGDDMLASFLGLLPWLCILHLGVAVWMVSYFKAPETDLAGMLQASISSALPGAEVQGLVGGARSSSANGTAGAQAVDWGADLEGSGFWLPSSDFFRNVDPYQWSRVFQTNALILLIPLVVLAAVKVLDVTVGSVISALAACFCARQSQGDEGLPPFSQALAENRLKGVTTYRLQHDPRYKDLFKCGRNSDGGEGGGIAAGDPETQALAAMSATSLLQKVMSGMEKRQSTPSQSFSGPTGGRPASRMSAAGSAADTSSRSPDSIPAYTRPLTAASSAAHGAPPPLSFSQPLPAPLPPQPLPPQPLPQPLYMGPAPLPQPLLSQPSYAQQQHPLAYPQLEPPSPSYMLVQPPPSAPPLPQHLADEGGSFLV